MRVAGDIPSFNVLNMIENEFMSKFHGRGGRLEVNWIEEACGIAPYIYEIKPPNYNDADDCWYLDSIDQELKQSIIKTFQSQP